MSRPTAESYQARASTIPPSEESFTESDGGLRAAKIWVEDQIRTFLSQHSLPNNIWRAGTVFAVASGQGNVEQAVAELTIHPEEDEYIFEWDDAPQS